MTFDREAVLRERYRYHWWDRAYYPMLALGVISGLAMVLTGGYRRGGYVIVVTAAMTIIMEFHRYKRRRYQRRTQQR